MPQEQHKYQVRKGFVDANAAACLGICPGFLNLICSLEEVVLLYSGSEQGKNMPDRDPALLPISMVHVPVHG